MLLLCSYCALSKANQSRSAAFYLSPLPDPPCSSPPVCCWSWNLWFGKNQNWKVGFGWTEVQARWSWAAVFGVDHKNLEYLTFSQASKLLADHFSAELPQQKTMDAASPVLHCWFFPLPMWPHESCKRMTVSHLSRPTISDAEVDKDADARQPSL